VAQNLTGGERKMGQTAGVRRARRIIDAALTVPDREIEWATTGSALGAHPAKRELEQAVSDYLDHHARGNARIPSTRK